MMAKPHFGIVIAGVCRSSACLRSSRRRCMTTLGRRFSWRAMRAPLRSPRGRIVGRQSYAKVSMSCWRVSSKSAMRTTARACSPSQLTMLSSAICCRTPISMRRRRNANGASRLWRGEWSISSIPIFGDRGGVFAFAILQGSTDPSFLGSH